MILLAVWTTYTQLSPLYLLSTLYITHVIKYSRPSTTFPYCKWRKAGWGLGTRLPIRRSKCTMQPLQLWLHHSFSWLNHWSICHSLAFSLCAVKNLFQDRVAIEVQLTAIRNQNGVFCPNYWTETTLHYSEFQAGIPLGWRVWTVLLHKWILLSRIPQSSLHCHWEDHSNSFLSGACRL